MSEFDHVEILKTDENNLIFIVDIITILTSGMSSKSHYIKLYEPRYDKTNKMAVRPAKTQISLGIRPV